MKQHKFKIQNTTYTIKFVDCIDNNPKILGRVKNRFWRPSKNKTLLIKSGLPLEKLLEVIFHELTHIILNHAADYASDHAELNNDNETLDNEAEALIQSVNDNEEAVKALSTVLQDFITRECMEINIKQPKCYQQ